MPIDPATGRLCGIGVSGSLRFTGVVSPASLAPGSGGGDPPYFAPWFDMLGLTPADGLVQSIRIEETSGFDLPLCRVVLANVDKRLSSTILAKEQSTFTSRIGWTNPGLQAHGTYVVQRPQFRYEADGRLSVEIVAYGEQVKLAATERREVYRRMRDSDIAQRIAERHGFAADVDRTDPVHDQVIQANESDYQFLARRALLHGFLVMVEDGVLKFHQPRPCESGVRLTCLDPTAGIDNFLRFRVQSRTFQRGLRLRISQVNPVTKEEFEVVSDDDPTPVQRDTGFTNWAEMVTVDGERPERFIVNEGHEQRREQLRDQVNRMAEATRYVVSGDGDAVGLDSLRPQQIISVADLGRSSGRYITTRVCHVLSGEESSFSYNTRFEFVRSGAGDADDPLRANEIQSADLRSAGAITSAPASAVSLLGGIF